MPELEQHLSERLDTLRSNGVAAYRKGNIDNAIELIEQAWAELPAPKQEYAESFHFSKYLALFYMKQGQLERAENWSIILQKCDMERVDLREREMLAGQVAYERGRLGSAKRLLTLAHHKSKGRLFLGKDPKYNKLIKSNEKVRSLEELQQSAYAYFSDREFNLAKDQYYDCLSYDEGLDDHDILLRKGQCHFELNELDAAADSLARAYMLGGIEIFEKEDPKYLSFLRMRMDI